MEINWIHGGGQADMIVVLGREGSGFESCTAGQPGNPGGRGPLSE